MRTCGSATGPRLNWVFWNPDASGHRTLKEEEIYWRIYDDPEDARRCLEEFRERYNTRRPHWALIPETGGDPVTPEDVYVHGLAMQIPKWQGWAREAKKRLEELMREDAA